MDSRAKFLTVALVLCVLLLSVAWLAELPPFEPVVEDPVGATGRLPPTPGDDGEAHAGDSPARDPYAPPDAGPVPGLKSTAPVQPPRDAPPPPGPDDAPPPPVRADAVRPTIEQPAEAPGPVPLEVEVSGKAVTLSVDKAVAWLIKKQARNGSWGDLRDVNAYTQFHKSEPVTQGAGPTALAVYTLLRAKVPLKHPTVRKGFDFLWKHHKQPSTSMETAMLLLAVTATANEMKLKGRRLTKPKVRGRYRSWAATLVLHLIDKRRARGWRYNVTGRVEPLHVGGPEDIVSTHLATLALFSAYQLGIRAKDQVWDEVLRYTLEQQEGATLHRPDPKKPRGFAYIHGHPVSDEGLATGGATACGLALVRMTMFILSGAGERTVPLTDSNRLLNDTALASLPAAEAWLVKHWSPYANPGKKKGAKVLHHHWLWALETAQDLQRAPPPLLGKHTWYVEIASELINRQRRDGSWRVLGSWAPADVLDTCFAILFLKRATRGLMPAR